jgi:hypothetical protein
MTNKPKVKGTDWETELVNYLNEFPFPDEAERTGSADFGSGDIHLGEWVIEAKNEARIDLPGYLKQLKAEVARNEFEPLKAVVMVKNRRHSVGDGYALMSIKDYRDLMLYIEVLERLWDSKHARQGEIVETQ